MVKRKFLFIAGSKESKIGGIRSFDTLKSAKRERSASLKSGARVSKIAITTRESFTGIKRKRKK